MNLLILGGNSDIGLAIAHTFAEEKKVYGIVLASRDRQELERNAPDLSIRFNVEVHTRYFDARDIGSHAEFYDKLPFRPDGVVLAFGYNGDQREAESNPEELRAIIETNFTGAASILEVIAGDFESREDTGDPRPFIIGISSLAGVRGRRKNYLYGASKAGLTAVLSGLRQRLRNRDIRVLTVKPGYVDTKMTRDMDLGKFPVLSPEQVARKTYAAWAGGKDTTCLTWYWRLARTALRMLPEKIFKKVDM